MQGANKKSATLPHDETLRREDEAKLASDGFTCSAEAQVMINAQSKKALHEGHSRRERIALGVFFCLLLLGAIALFSYISAGHNLNVAATSIDDIAGDMSGYGVILFEGTVRVDASSDDEGEDDDIISDVLDAVGLGDESTSSASEEEAATDESDTASSSDLAQSDTSDAQDSADSANTESESSDSSEPSTSATYSSSSLGISSSDITIEEVQQEYLDKGASVITLDSDNLQLYSEGRIIMQDERTYGIFSLTEDDLADMLSYDLTTTRTVTTVTESASGDSVTNTTTRTRGAFTSVSELFESIDEGDIDSDVIEKIESIVEHFDEAGVDTIIALTPSAVPFCAVEGVDVVVTFKESDRFSVSETIDGTLYVDAPEVGQVGVLMVAPGNVVSTKVVTGD